MYRREHLRPKRRRFSFRPDFVAENVGAIDFAYLASIGITTLFVDLDNTVVSKGTYDVDAKLKELLRSCPLDIKIATNRPKSRDLKELKEDLNASGVIHPIGIYGKPTKRYFQAALRANGLKATEVAMVGDRYLQDVLGANRSGIYSLLVFKLGKSMGKLDQWLSDAEKRYTQKLIHGYVETK